MVQASQGQNEGADEERRHKALFVAVSTLLDRRGHMSGKRSEKLDKHIMDVRKRICAENGIGWVGEGNVMGDHTA